MPYKFTFDISKAPQRFFIELAILSNQMGMQKVFSKTLQVLIKKFRIQEISGLDIQDAIVLIQDLIEMQTLNLIQKQEFLKTKKRLCSFPTAVGNTWIVDAKPFSSQVGHRMFVLIARPTVLLTKRNILPEKKGTMFTFCLGVLVCLTF